MKHAHCLDCGAEGATVRCTVRVPGRHTAADVDLPVYLCDTCAVSYLTKAV